MGCTFTNNFEVNIELKNSIKNKYDVIIKKKIYKNSGNFNLIEENIMQNIEKEDGLEIFISILNLIYKNIDEINQEYIAQFKIHTKNIIKNILPEDEANLKIKIIDNFLENKYDIYLIKEFGSIFELIYNNKYKINICQIICYIESLNNLLKEIKNELINDTKITFFINKLYEIYLGNIPNDKDPLFPHKETSEILLKQSSISSLSSQNQIKKMEKIINELKAKVDLLSSEKICNNNNNELNINSNNNFTNINNKNIKNKIEIEQFDKFIKEEESFKESGNNSKNN